MMRYLDVCSGYSAFTLGAADLGFRCVGYSEIEPFPRAILEQRHGAVPVDWDHRHRPDANTTPLFHDFTQIEAHHVGPVDLLTGGTPCQAFSVAGKRLGLDDPRGNLTLEFLALARRLRVEWLVWENVPGFLSHDGGRTMGTFLGLLGQVGYGWAYRVLDAQYVRVDRHKRAVPQRRRRLFVVAHLGDAAGPAAVLFERESLRGDPAPRRDTGEGVAPTISARTRGGGGLGTDFDCDGGLIPQGFGGGNTSGPIPVAAALAAHGRRQDFEVETFIAEAASTLPAGGNATGGDRQPDTSAETAATMLVGFRVTPNDGAYETGDRIDSLTTGTDRTAHVVVREPFVMMERGRPEGRTLEYRQDGTANAILTPNGGRSGMGVGAVAFAIQAGATRENPASGPDGVGVQSDVAYTIEARAEVQAVQHGWAVRRLTPTECERLMGVPDGFTAVTYRKKPAADGPRYKALGNSQAVNVMRWIARGLRDVVDAQAERAA